MPRSLLALGELQDADGSRRWKAFQTEGSMRGISMKRVIIVREPSEKKTLELCTDHQLLYLDELIEAHDWAALRSRRNL